MRATQAIYFVILIGANAVGLRRWRKFRPGEQIIELLLLVTLFAEAFALYAAHKWHTNLFVYHIFCPISFFLVSLYFNYSISIFRKFRTGIVVGILGILIAIINAMYFQKITQINSYFLLFEGGCVIIYCLFSIYQITMDEAHLATHFAHFWIMLFFLIFWCATITGWGMYTVLHQRKFILVPVFEAVLTAANYVLYMGIAVVFFQYKKLIPSGE